MNEAILIAASKKRADLHVWLGRAFDNMMTDKKVFLIGLAAGLHLDPEVDAALSDRGRAYIPDPAMGRQFIVHGIETWGAFYEAYEAVDQVVARHELGETSVEQAVAEIEAIQIGI